ncbi:uncharacterized protein A1O9_08513 [Exophiala aquamarina CBS 119918]|uniref:N-acetyltransferase domain-containing protein n=1 Tax=Exophiala aquamarina CBS 119918 TaxID=1182545 RepID=A0A072P7T6_9EURO|nr:uncharacterized protein A1O9_08513 [Exophiala aquamarina CBS 119918]KEF55762.1 hypothetical protein A1O9_08513 [Exophiala aquamarina CBS 119918]
MASSTGSLPAPLPSPLAQSASFADDREENTAADLDPALSHRLDSVPPLTTTPAVTEDDKVEALHLLADSVAQQRQIASTATIFHPSTLSLMILALGLVYQYFYHGSRSDLALVGTTSAGIVMSVLITVRWLTSPYIEEAERVGTWRWLDLGRNDANTSSSIVGSEDEILLTRFGDEVIGTIFIRGVRDDCGGSSSSPTNTSSANSSPKKTRAKNLPVTALIRGWTVKRRYRHKGIGTGLLEEAVALAQSKGWHGPEFAEDHANSAKLMPMTFLSGFVKREKLARLALEKVKSEKGVTNDVGKNGRRAKR